MIVEILIYILAAISGLCITGFAVHMFVGGLVSTEAEYTFIALACFVVSCAIAYMVWDVMKRRSGKR